MSLSARREGEVGTLSKTCLSEGGEMHTGVTEIVLSPVVYGNFSFWHGCDFVASFG